MKEQFRRMNFNLVSDLHLEFADQVLPGGDVLLLAGDITVAATLTPRRTDSNSIKVRERSLRFFSEECAKYNKVFYVFGNHEYYSGIWETVYDITTDALKDTNVRILRDETVDLGNDLMLFGGTLWTDFDGGKPEVARVAQNSMNDYYQIHKLGNRNLTPVDTESASETTKELLKEALKTNPNKSFLVMTHHAPSYKSIHPKYGNDALNFAFSSNLDHIMEQYPQIKNWVHGHTHTTFDYTINQTRVHCNPRGYANWHGDNENSGFNSNYTFEA